MVNGLCFSAGKVSPPMTALPGPHYRNNPHPKADFLLWRHPRKQWPMKEAEKSMNTYLLLFKLFM